MDQGLHLSDARYKKLLAKIALLEAQASESGLDVRVLPFTFASPSPLVLAPLPAGCTVIRSAIEIETVFDGVGTTLRLGTPATPGLVIDAAFNDPAMVGQYEQDQMVHIGSPTTLQLTIFPAGSTQGDGFVLFEIRLP